MQDVLGKRKAFFSHKTFGVLRMMICARTIRSRESLRHKKDTRNDMYFNMGLNAMNTECDIGYIVRHVRILRYFLKTVLDKDQRVLLKIKSQEQLRSDDDRPTTKDCKKKINKDLLLERYIENLQQKTLGKQDIKLLEVLGFQKALKLLKE